MQATVSKSELGHAPLLPAYPKQLMWHKPGECEACVGTLSVPSLHKAGLLVA